MLFTMLSSFDKQNKDNAQTPGRQTLRLPGIKAATKRQALSIQIFIVYEHDG